MSLGERFTGVVRAAVGGDEGAWRELYGELAGALRTYFVMRGVPDADDLVGEVFADLARNLGRFEGDEAGFRSWVFTIAHHRFVDHVRGSARRPTEQLSDGSIEALPLTGRADTETEVFARLGVDRLRALVDQLSPDQRDVILLRYVGDQSMEEIAATLGKQPNAVKALHLRALRSLRRILATVLLPLLLLS